MFDYIPPYILVPLAIVLWFAVLIIWMRKPAKELIHDYFAHRRHLRRERRRQEDDMQNRMMAYLEADTKLVRQAFKPNSPRHSATAR